MMAALSCGSLVMAQNSNDTLSEKMTELRDRLNGVEERVAVNESDLSKLNKIKFSGYIQAQYEHYENPLTYPSNSIFLRRARLKTAYQPADGVTFVLQSDFLPSGFALKDAYVVLNDRWTKNFSLWVGQFNRPNYEVEYSSSQREVPERSRVIRALYPGERALGAKLEFAPAKFPLKLQLALLNGNDNLTYNAGGTSTNVTNKDYDNFKDVMARATYGFKLGNFGGLDLGAHMYSGSVKSNVDSLIESDYTFDKTVKVGDALRRNWFGAEFQLFADVLGGASLKGEFITGSTCTPGFQSKTTTTTQGTPVLINDTLTLSTTVATTTTYIPNQKTNFMGYYLYFIKNVGKKNQFAFRYDFYDPNTKISGDEVGLKKYDKSYASAPVVTTASSHEGNQTILNKRTVTNTVTNKLASSKNDLAYTTLTFAWLYYFDESIRITLAYEMPMNEKTANLKDVLPINGISKTNEYKDVFSQNTLTLRIQAKF